MNVTPEQRAEWRALADNATPGPWYRTDDAPESEAYIYIAYTGPDSTAPLSEWEVSTPATPAAEAWVDGHGRLGGPPAAESLDASFISAARTAVPALLDALDAAERERDKAQRAARTLGKVVEDQCRDIARITRSEHMVSADGDADWAAIWERGHRLAAERDALAARIEQVREVHKPVDGVHGEIVCAHRHCVDDAQDQCSWPCPTIRALDGEVAG